MAEAKAWVMIPKLRDSTDNEVNMVLDMRPLVPCKDCKHGEKCNSVYLCGKSRGFGVAHEPNWFCADGDPKD